jgi:hypothetical protein
LTDAMTETCFTQQRGGIRAFHSCRCTA